jgi:hypothetical protein
MTSHLFSVTGRDESSKSENDPDLYLIRTLIINQNGFSDKIILVVEIDTVIDA